MGDFAKEMYELTGHIGKCRECQVLWEECERLVQQITAHGSKTDEVDSK